MLLQISFDELSIGGESSQKKAISMLLHASKYLTRNFLIDLSIPENYQFALTAMDLNLNQKEITNVEFLINGIVDFCRMNSCTQIRLNRLGQTFLLLEIFSEHQLPVGSQWSIQ